MMMHQVGNARGSNDRVVFMLGAIIVMLLIWNILLTTNVIKPEKMNASGGLQAFDGSEQPDQTQSEKKALRGEANREFNKKFGSAFGGEERSGNPTSEDNAIAQAIESVPTPSRNVAFSGATNDGTGNQGVESIGMSMNQKEAMRAFYKGAGIQMSAPIKDGRERYGGASSIGEKERMSLDDPENPLRGEANFLYTEKMQAFEGGEKYKVTTGRTCAASTLNHLTDMVIDTCQAHCAHDSQCAAFSYNFTNGDCRTFNSCQRLVQSDAKVQTFSRER
jgi:hypothetical protein